MAVKSNFASGDVLTASDVNTYLTNGGLVYVGEGSVTSQTTLSLNSVFSSSYTFYRIITRCQSDTNGTTLRMRLINSGGTESATNYLSRYMGYDPSVNATTFGESGTSTTDFIIGGAGTTGGNEPAMAVIDLGFPYETNYTTLSASFTGVRRAIVNLSGTSGGMHQLANSYTGIKLLPSSGSITASVFIYGYRKA